MGKFYLWLKYFLLFKIYLNYIKKLIRKEKKNDNTYKKKKYIFILFYI